MSANFSYVDEDTGEVVKLSARRVRRPWQREPFLTVIDGESMTVVSEQEACDVNRIVASFSRTGELPSINEAFAQYADVSELGGDLGEQYFAAQDVLGKYDSWHAGVQAAEKEAADKKAADDLEAEIQRRVDERSKGEVK